MKFAQITFTALTKCLPISGVFSSSSCTIQLEPFVSPTMVEDISCSGLWHQLLKSWKFSPQRSTSKDGVSVDGGNIDAAESRFLDHVAANIQLYYDVLKVPVMQHQQVSACLVLHKTLWESTVQCHNLIRPAYWAAHRVIMYLYGCHNSRTSLWKHSQPESSNKRYIADVSVSVVRTATSH